MFELYYPIKGASCYVVRSTGVFKIHVVLFLIEDTAYRKQKGRTRIWRQQAKMKPRAILYDI